jgi:hypothetical protein
MKQHQSADQLLLDRLYEVRRIFYKNNERKAELNERRLAAYEQWAQQVEILLSMNEYNRRNNDGEKTKELSK